ncbi:unnamed protein product [Discosporangium mesarthrocarpum]
MACTTKGTGKSPKRKTFQSVESVLWKRWTKIRREMVNVIMPFAARELQKGTPVSGKQAQDFFAGPLQLHVRRGAGEEEEGEAGEHSCCRRPWTRFPL